MKVKNLYPHPPIGFNEHLRRLSDKLSSTNFVGLIDSCAMWYHPIVFISKKDYTMFFTVNNYDTACRATLNLSKPMNLLSQSPELILTAKIMTPIKIRKIAQDKRQYLEEGLKKGFLNLNIKEGIETGLISSKNALKYQIQCKPDFTISSKLDFIHKSNGFVYSWKYDNGYFNKVAIPGYYDVGFKSHPINELNSVKILTNQIHNYYKDIARTITEMIKLQTGFRSFIIKDNSIDGYNTMRDKEMAFIYAIILGLVTVTTGGGIITESVYRNEKIKNEPKIINETHICSTANVLFLQAALHGYSTIHNLYSHEKTILMLLSHLFQGESEDCVYRGLFNVLPMSYIGYGFLNKSKKFHKDSVGGEHKDDFVTIHIQQMIAGLVSRGINFDTNPAEITKTVYDLSNPIPEFLPFRSCSIGIRDFLTDIRNIGIYNSKALPDANVLDINEILEQESIDNFTANTT
jgi:hypothetical protein